MSAKYVDVVVAGDEVAPMAERGAVANVTNQGSGGGGAGGGGGGGDAGGEGGAGGGEGSAGGGGSGGSGGGGDGVGVGVGVGVGGGGGEGGEGGGGDGGGGIGWVRSVASFSLSQGVGLLAWVGDSIGAPVNEAAAGGLEEKAAAEAAAAAAAAATAAAEAAAAEAAEAAAAEAAAAAVAAAAEAAAAEAEAEAEAEAARRAEAAKFFWQREAPRMSWLTFTVRLTQTFVAGIALGGMGYGGMSSMARIAGGVGGVHRSPAHQSPSMWKNSSPTIIVEPPQHRVEYEDDVDLSLSACGLRFIGNIFTGAARYAGVLSEPVDDSDDGTAMAGGMEMWQDKDGDVDLSISGCGLRFIGNIFTGAAKFAGVYLTPEDICRLSGDRNCILGSSSGSSSSGGNGGHTGNARRPSEATRSWAERGRAAFGDALLDGPWV